MIMLLDLGNISLDVCVYQNRKRLFDYRTYSDKLKSEEEYEGGLARFLSYNNLSKSDIDGAILSSVVPALSKRIQKAVTKLIGKECLVLSRSLKTGLAIRMDNPSEVGSDLISEAVGAINDYQKDSLVIDLSNVLSFIVVNDKKEFVGGSLLPGMRFSASQMFSYNAQLMDIELGKPRRLLGKSTKESMNSGIVAGYVTLIKNYALEIEKEYGKPLLKVLTGSDSAIIKDLLPQDYIYNPDVVFDGLYDIYMKNNRN